MDQNKLARFGRAINWRDLTSTVPKRERFQKYTRPFQKPISLLFSCTIKEEVLYLAVTPILVQHH
jgi:hypothetical protein